MKGGTRRARPLSGCAYVIFLNLHIISCISTMMQNLFISSIENKVLLLYEKYCSIRIRSIYCFKFLSMVISSMRKSQVKWIVIIIWRFTAEPDMCDASIFWTKRIVSGKVPWNSWTVLARFYLKSVDYQRMTVSTVNVFLFCYLIKWNKLLS